MKPKFSNIRQFTNEHISLFKIPEDADDFEMIFNNSYSDQEFAEHDYVIGDLMMDGQNYIFIHGFPGDEPCGVVFNLDFSYICAVHHDDDANYDHITDWYLDSVLTEDGVKIPEEWFVSK